MKATTKRRMILVGGVLALLSAGATAQGFYDDDIYFDASKARKEKAEKTAKTKTPARVYSAPATVTTSVSRAADPEAGSSRNVDEYNRRGSYKPVKEQNADLGDNFTYTRRIERFSNPDIVADSDDDDLRYYYNYANDELAGSTGYASPATINIYVDNIDPWDNFWSPYYYSSAWSWAWRPAYYNPWWSYNYWSYGPTWSWSWGWNPGWNWGWGPSWSWHPGWNHGWGWVPPHHHHPAPSPGHRPGGWGGPGVSGTHGRRPSANRGESGVGRRPAGTRPTVTANRGNRNGSSSSTVSGRRPGNSRPTGTYNPSNATRPGRSDRYGTSSSSSSSSTGRQGYNRGTSRRGSSNSSSSSSSYGSGRRGSSSSSSGSYYNSGSSGRSSGGSHFNGGRSSGGSGRSSGGRSGGGRSGGGRR